jgi:hypothetical protein
VSWGGYGKKATKGRGDRYLIISRREVELGGVSKVLLGYIRGYIGDVMHRKGRRGV